MMAVLNADLNRRGSQNISKCPQISIKFKYFSNDLEDTPMMAVLNADINWRGFTNISNSTQMSIRIQTLQTPNFQIFKSEINPSITQSYIHSPSAIVCRGGQIKIYFSSQKS
ncbi:hypothetical protein KFK09_010806 [Dendrobium nobile]|uniref:Uncharacterized protein n=1 Tax=Dendrobium nobile TaxID=94219 RepID=A0A8T3BE29_DENNO|nr:hypothetical protein KFK09_010806 [Dendrobium nobile]